MTADIAGLLRSLPLLQPPADGWRRIAARQARQARRRWAGLAIAASLASAAVTGWLILGSPEGAAPAVTVQPFIVEAPARGRAAPRIDTEILALRRRSQDMERLLGNLPPRGRRARADTVGAIAELEDQIAVVDYRLNRAGQATPGFAGGPAARSGADEVPELWRRRIVFMDQLVRARYAESAAAGP